MTAVFSLFGLRILLSNFNMITKYSLILEFLHKKEAPSRILDGALIIRKDIRVASDRMLELTGRNEE